MIVIGLISALVAWGPLPEIGSDAVCTGFGDCTDADASGGGVTVVGSGAEGHTGRGAGGSTEGPTGGAYSPTAVVERAVPACARNGPDGSDAMCAEAVRACAGFSKEPGVRVWVFRRVIDRRTGAALSAWTFVGARCETKPLPARPTPDQIRTVLLSDSRYLPAPASRTHVDPRSGRTVVHAEVVVSADSPASFDTDVTVLGERVHVALRPQRWEWDFGDGTTTSTATPGRPFPSHEIDHRYSQPGDVGVRVSVEWGGTFSVAGTTYPINGTARVAGPPTALHVGEARAELVSPTG